MECADVVDDGHDVVDDDDDDVDTLYAGRSKDPCSHHGEQNSNQGERSPSAC